MVATVFWSTSVFATATLADWDPIDVANDVSFAINERHFKVDAVMTVPADSNPLLEFTTNEPGVRYGLHIGDDLRIDRQGPDGTWQTNYARAAFTHPRTLESEYLYRIELRDHTLTVTILGSDGSSLGTPTALTLPDGHGITQVVDGTWKLPSGSTRYFIKDTVVLQQESNLYTNFMSEATALKNEMIAMTEDERGDYEQYLDIEVIKSDLNYDAVRAVVTESETSNMESRIVDLHRFMLHKISLFHENNFLVFGSFIPKTDYDGTLLCKLHVGAQSLELSRISDTELVITYKQQQYRPYHTLNDRLILDTTHPAYRCLNGESGFTKWWLNCVSSVITLGLGTDPGVDPIWQYVDTNFVDAPIDINFTVNAQDGATLPQQTITSGSYDRTFTLHTDQIEITPLLDRTTSINPADAVTLIPPTVQHPVILPVSSTEDYQAVQFTLTQKIGHAARVALHSFDGTTSTHTATLILESETATLIDHFANDTSKTVPYTAPADGTPTTYWIVQYKNGIAVGTGADLTFENSILTSYNEVVIDDVLTPHPALTHLAIFGGDTEPKAISNVGTSDYNLANRRTPFMPNVINGLTHYSGTQYASVNGWNGSQPFWPLRHAPEDASGAAPLTATFTLASYPPVVDVTSKPSLMVTLSPTPMTTEPDYSLSFVERQTSDGEETTEIKVIGYNSDTDDEVITPSLTMPHGLNGTYTLSYNDESQTLVLNADDHSEQYNFDVQEAFGDTSMRYLSFEAAGEHPIFITEPHPDVNEFAHYRNFLLNADLLLARIPTLSDAERTALFSGRSFRTNEQFTLDYDKALSEVAGDGTKTALLTAKEQQIYQSLGAQILTEYSMRTSIAPAPTGDSFVTLTFQFGEETGTLTINSRPATSRVELTISLPDQDPETISFDDTEWSDHPLMTNWLNGNASANKNIWIAYSSIARDGGPGILTLGFGSDVGEDPVHVIDLRQSRLGHPQFIDITDISNMIIDGELVTDKTAYKPGQAMITLSEPPTEYFFGNSDAPRPALVTPLSFDSVTGQWQLSFTLSQTSQHTFIVESEITPGRPAYRITATDSGLITISYFSQEDGTEHIIATQNVPITGGALTPTGGTDATYWVAYEYGKIALGHGALDWSNRIVAGEFPEQDPGLFSFARIMTEARTAQTFSNMTSSSNRLDWGEVTFNTTYELMPDSFSINGQVASPEPQTVHTLGIYLSNEATLESASDLTDPAIGLYRLILTYNTAIPPSIPASCTIALYRGANTIPLDEKIINLTPTLTAALESWRTGSPLRFELFYHRGTQTISSSSIPVGILSFALQSDRGTQATIPVWSFTDQAPDATINRLSFVSPDQNSSYINVTDADLDGTPMQNALNRFVQFTEQRTRILNDLATLVHPALGTIPSQLPDATSLTTELNDARLVDHAKEAAALRIDLDEKLVSRHTSLMAQAATQLATILSVATDRYNLILSPDITDDELDAIEPLDPTQVANTKTELHNAALYDVPQAITLPTTVLGMTVPADAPSQTVTALNEINTLAPQISAALTTLSIDVADNTEVDPISGSKLTHDTIYALDQAASRISNSRGVRDVQVNALTLTADILQQYSVDDLVSLITNGGALNLSNEIALVEKLNEKLNTTQIIADYGLSTEQQSVIEAIVESVKDAVQAQHSIIIRLDEQEAHVAEMQQIIQTSSTKADLDGYSTDLAGDEQGMLQTAQTKAAVLGLLQPYLDHLHSTVSTAAGTAHARHLSVIERYYDETTALVAQRYLQLRTLSDCATINVIAAADHIRTELDGLRTAEAIASYDLTDFNTLVTAARTARTAHGDDDQILTRQEHIVASAIRYQQIIRATEEALSEVTGLSGSAADLMTRLRATTVTSRDELAAVDNITFTSHIEALEGMVQIDTPRLERTLSPTDGDRIIRELSLYKGLVNAVARYQHHIIVANPTAQAILAEMNELIDLIIPLMTAIEAMDTTSLAAQKANLEAKEDELALLEDKLSQLRIFDKNNPDNPAQLYRDAISFAIAKRAVALTHEQYVVRHTSERALLDTLLAFTIQNVFSEAERTRLISELKDFDDQTPALAQIEVAQTYLPAHPKRLHKYSLIRERGPLTRVSICKKSISGMLDQYDSVSQHARLEVHSHEVTMRETEDLTSTALAARWTAEEQAALSNEGEVVAAALASDSASIANPTPDEQVRFDAEQARRDASQPFLRLSARVAELEEHEKISDDVDELISAVNNKIVELSTMSDANRIAEKATISSEIARQVERDTIDAQPWSEADALIRAASDNSLPYLAYNIRRTLFTLRKAILQTVSDIPEPPALEDTESIKVPGITYNWNGDASRTLTFSPGLAGITARFYLRAKEGRGFALGLQYQRTDGTTAHYDLSVGEENNTNSTLQRRTSSSSLFLFGNERSRNSIGVPDTNEYVFYHFEQVGTEIHLLRYDNETQTFVTVLYVNDLDSERDTSTPLTVSFHKLANQGEYLEIKNLSVEPNATVTDVPLQPLQPTVNTTPPVIPTLPQTPEEVIALDTFSALIAAKDERLALIPSTLTLPEAITGTQISELETLFATAYDALVAAAQTNEEFTALPTNLQEAYFASAQASHEGRIEQAEAARIELDEALTARAAQLTNESTLAAETLLDETLKTVREKIGEAQDALTIEAIPDPITTFDMTPLETAFAAAGMPDDPRITGATSEVAALITTLNDEVSKAHVRIQSIIALDGNVLSIPPSAETNFITMPHAKVNGKNSRRVTVAASGTDGITLRFADRAGNTYRFRIDQSGIYRSMNGPIDTSVKAFNTSINFSNHPDSELRDSTYQVTVTMVENTVFHDGQNVPQLHITFGFTQQLVYGTRARTRRARTSFVIEPQSQHAHMLYLPHQYTLSANATQVRVEPLNELPEHAQSVNAVTVSQGGIIQRPAQAASARTYRAPTTNPNRGLRL